MLPGNGFLLPLLRSFLRQRACVWFNPVKCTVTEPTTLINQVRLCITYYHNKYLYNSAISDYPYIHTTSPHIGDTDNTTRIMDSGRIEDFLKQYITQWQNLQGESLTGREQQEENDKLTQLCNYEQRYTSRDIQSGSAASAVLARATSCVVRLSRGAIYLGWHH
jgi:hypothetical protein